MRQMTTLPSPASHDEVAFLIDFEQGEVSKVTPMDEMTLQSVGLKERADLQRWISDHPEIVGHGLLLVTSEFDQWELREQKVPDRLDVLFLDGDGSPVVAELKRDKATDTTELQALKYAAYCSQLTLEDLIEEYARFHKIELEQARADLLAHAPMLVEGEPAPVRIRLVAGSFGPSVTSVVLWLRDHDASTSVAFRSRPAGSGPTGRAFRAADDPAARGGGLPSPRRRRKEQEEEERKKHQRRSDTYSDAARQGRGC